MTVFIEPVNS